MIEIDGSVGEGGGQIVRTAIALAAITGQEVEIRNIRANRPNPGLAAQHLHAVKAVERLSRGKTEGLQLHSQRLKFSPGDLKCIHTELDIGTAGSITLLLQCLIPVALFADCESVVTVKGGTDVRWAPPIDFYTGVFLKALRVMGCDIWIDMKRRGYYPRGGGVVEVRISPLAGGLRGFKPEYVQREQGEGAESRIVKGISHSRGLPTHVTERQARAAEQILHDCGYSTAIEREVDDKTATAVRATTGSGITLWLGYKSGSALGKPGKRAEFVGEEAAHEILKELNSSSSVDIHLADQLIPYIALADGGSELRVREMTEHLRTNIYVTKRFLDIEFEVMRISGDDVVEIRRE